MDFVILYAYWFPDWKESNSPRQGVSSDRARLPLHHRVISYKETILNGNEISVEFKGLIFEDLTAKELKEIQTEFTEKLEKLPGKSVNTDLKNILKSFVAALSTSKEIGKKLNDAKSNFENSAAQVNKIFLKDESKVFELLEKVKKYDNEYVYVQ